ncbi:MAG: epoxyqueuosine reductase QueH [Deltaproteobacteria bacterium]|nr:epoxyqueuosine reductase QueH [Deltaproteobacteria bacterium]
MKVLLHICCAPCSTYSALFLRENGYDVTGFFYNPNIYPREEIIKRESEAKRFFSEINLQFVSDISGVEDWYRMTEKLRDRREGDIRCNICFAVRLDRTAREALSRGIECFTTTLTIAPMKNSKKIFRIGNLISRKYSLRFLEVDFKKRDGFKKSCRMSEEYYLYRQNYCGCEYSYKERLIKEKKRTIPL